MSGGVEGLFLVISHTFPIYKQLSTQGTITSCSLNKLDVKNHWVLRDLENPQALSSALAALRRYSPGPSSFLNPVEPWFLTSNYYIYHFSVGVQRYRSVFNSHVARGISRYFPGNIMGKRFANDFDTQPVQRIDAL